MPDDDALKAAAGDDLGGGDKSAEELAAAAAAGADDGQGDGDGDGAGDEHKDRSKLGRKVAEMGTKMDDFFDRMGTFMEVNRAPAAPAPKAPENPYANVDDDGEVVTTKDVLKIVNDLQTYNQSRLSHEQIQYEEVYKSQLNELGRTEDKGTHQEIVDEMMQNFNVKYSTDGISDAERNYFKAARAVLKKKNADPENPLKGGGDGKGLGVGGDSKDKSKDVKLPEMDDVTKDYIARMGIKEETVKKAFS